MKIRITLKDPDGVGESIRDAADEGLSEIPNLSDEEHDLVYESRLENLGVMCSKWIQFCEYVTIEIDTEAKTAIVVPVGG